MAKKKITEADKQKIKEDIMKLEFHMDQTASVIKEKRKLIEQETKSEQKKKWNRSVFIAVLIFIIFVFGHFSGKLMKADFISWASYDLVGIIEEIYPGNPIECVVKKPDGESCQYFIPKGQMRTNLYPQVGYFIYYQRNAFLPVNICEEQFELRSVK